MHPGTGISTSETKLLFWLLVIASLLLAVGMVVPMMTLTKFIYLRSSFSVMSGVCTLLKNGHVIMFIVVAGFSVVLPVMKIGLLFSIINKQAHGTERTKKYLYLLHEYGRWSMLDVMVVAVLIVTVKLGAVASVKVHAGLYFFCASVFLIMVITKRVVDLTKIQEY